MKRRRLIVATLATAIVVRGHAQISASSMPRVVLVSNSDEAGFRQYRNSFVEGMRLLGHSEGRTFRFEVLYANLEPVRSEGLIRQAIASRPDVLVVTGLANARYAKGATNTIPVVVATSSDLADAGVVASLARPGGNVTGITDLADEGAVKRLEILKELLPKLGRVALLSDPNFPASRKIEARVSAAARTLGITLTLLHAADRASLDRVLASLDASRPDALLVAGAALFTVNARQLIERATVLRIPVAHYWPGTAESGALISHQADIHRNYERAAYYVDRILKGTHPADLPVEQPTRFELVVNRATATALGIQLSPAMLLRADRVIE